MAESREDIRSSTSVRGARRARPLAARLRDLPLKIKTILIAAGCFVICGFVIVLVSALIVNRMKNQLVTVAREEVRRLGEQSVAEIERVMQESRAASLSEITNNPQVRAQLKIMSSEGGVVLAAMVDANGKSIYQQLGEDQLVRQCPVGKGGRLGGLIPGSEEMTWELEVLDMPEGVTPERVPIRKDGATVGFLEYGLMESDVLGRLNPISQHITRSLGWMVALSIVCLGATIWLLCRVADRHIALQRRHDEAQHLAKIGTMASGLAHEIRNPLHAMNLHLESAKEELEDPRADSPEQVRHIVGNVQRQIENLSATLTSFMNYALPAQLEREPHRLSSLVNEVVTSIGPEFKTRDVEVSVQVPEDAWILGDATALRQVVVNVMLNAAQIMDGLSVKKIDVTCEAEKGHYLLHIDDTGPGLPRGREEAIFEVFVSHRKGGSGFGLAIARRIMEEHRGSITGQTRAQGGARFTLEFPSAPAAGIVGAGVAGAGVDVSARPASA